MFVRIAWIQVNVQTSAYLYLSAVLCASQGSFSFVKTLQRIVIKKKTTDNLILCSSVSENITIIVCLTVPTKTQTSTQA